ncbi:uncharacterized protein LOC120633174 [Pararge aegeria]|uniref:uncharacterized protein LOC120633174 n=1 Tax=Pararge aegeria TaxID=116150 RepID=UPI0019CFCD5D|nr:uncharacterized protein LOC120633174 [Pararge aegeria]
MSGYLEVKYPFKSNIGLNPFKSWKRQWCILRPGPSAGGGSLAVYCSEAGASAGIVELRSGCVVKRAKSRTRPHAFAVFSIEEPCKPKILLAAQTLQEAQQWMDKIRELLSGQKLLGTETLLKDSYSVTIIPTELSQKCGISGDSNLTLSSTGLTVSPLLASAVLIRWRNVTDVLQERENGDKNKTCILSVDSGFHGGGEMRLATALNSDLAAAIKLALKESVRGVQRSRSHPELNTSCDVTGELRRSSWYSGPSEVSLDDTDLIMSKESQRMPSGQLSRCSGGLLRASLTSLDDSMCDRRSLVSVSSGVYEEISEEPRPRALEEPTYESVADCIYATMRRSGKRHPPPPLPPRHPYHTMKLGESWSCRMGGGAGDAGVTRHSSLGSLHHKPARPAKPFSVFRKRLKSDSRIATSPNTNKNKDVETKKKKFDFTPTRDIFKSFKVSRKMKNLKINSGLSKGETKSCEFLDETQHVTSNRCSKSVECLEGNGYDEFDGNISLEVTEDQKVDFVPQELFQLILCPDLSKVRLKDNQCLQEPCECENDYLPMSPIVPPPMEHHYMVMSPRTHLA